MLFRPQTRKTDRSRNCDPREHRVDRAEAEEISAEAAQPLRPPPVPAPYIIHLRRRDLGCPAHTDRALGAAGQEAERWLQRQFGDRDQEFDPSPIGRGGRRWRLFQFERGRGGRGGGRGRVGEGRGQVDDGACPSQDSAHEEEMRATACDDGAM